MTNLSFGVEFEVFGPPLCQTFERFETLLRYFGPRYKIKFGGGWDIDYCCRSSSNYNVWHIHEDGSLREDHGSGVGLEIASPILKNQKGLDEVRRFINLLNDIGCKVNKSCGLHVHINADKFTTEEKIAVLSRYSKHEKLIDKFVTNNRRKNHSQHAQSIDIEDVLFDYEEQLSYDSRTEYSNAKSSKVHLHPELPTIEYRQHEGSLEENKVLNWIEFCANFTKQSVMAYRKFKRAEKNNIVIYTKLMGTVNPMIGLDKYKVRHFNKLSNKNKKAA